MTEGYKVEVDKIPQFTCEELQAWFEVYCVEYIDHTDMHEVFANRLNITRPKAKALAHRIAFSGMKGMYNLGHGG